MALTFVNNWTNQLKIELVGKMVGRVWCNETALSEKNYLSWRCTATKKNWISLLYWHVPSTSKRLAYHHIWVIKDYYTNNFNNVTWSAMTNVWSRLWTSNNGVRSVHEWNSCVWVNCLPEANTLILVSPLNWGLRKETNSVVANNNIQILFWTFLSWASFFTFLRVSWCLRV